MTHVRYADSQRKLPVTLIKEWERGEIPEAIMSSSSGPKDYLKNDVFALFDRNPQTDLVILVRSAGALVFLVRAGGNWFDVGGKPVVIT